MFERQNLGEQVFLGPRWVNSVVKGAGFIDAPKEYLEPRGKEAALLRTWLGVWAPPMASYCTL